LSFYRPFIVNKLFFLKEKFGYCDRQEDIFLCADKRLLEIAIAEGVLIMDALAPFEKSEK
jgi:hypothetical protein